MTWRNMFGWILFYAAVGWETRKQAWRDARDRRVL